MKKRGRIKFRAVKTWQLAVILIPLLFLDATLLRIDHIKMTELREAVLQADEKGDEAEIEQSLVDLQEFVFNNIVINVIDDNGAERVIFGTGPFYLEQQYLRDANAALQLAEQESSDSNPNGNVYAKAAEVCKPQAIANGWAWNSSGYIECMTGEIAKYPSADEIADDLSAELPSTELYRKNYASPVWVPTLSGLMILVTMVIIAVIFIRFLVWGFLRISLLFM